jgi:toxin ParE1/3/4
MGSYALSGKADSDILQIARDSVKQWGLARAEEYVLGLHQAFQRLAEFPDMGRDASHLRTGYMRMESMSHVVFYRKIESGILIVRILHNRMDFVRHL